MAEEREHDEEALEAPEEEETAEAEAGGGDEVEVINGHPVGFAFLRRYREHPEIGLPVQDQVGDDQEFEHAILHWTGSEVEAEWREYQPDEETGGYGRGAAAEPESERLVGAATGPTTTPSAASQPPQEQKRPWWKFW